MRIASQTKGLALDGIAPATRISGEEGSTAEG
jgi:hypothetical protein